MALRYEEVKSELEGTPLTDDEKSFINLIEAYIDKVIKERLDSAMTMYYHTWEAYVDTHVKKKLDDEIFKRIRDGIDAKFKELRERLCI